MTLLCTQADVLDRPALSAAGISTFTETQAAQVDGYIEEASVLVEGYLGHTYADPPTDGSPNPDPVPDAARLVAARVVARALTSTPVDPNFDSYSSAMGPFSHQKHVAQDVLGGGVWLTRQDKMALDAIDTNARISNISTYHPEPTPVGLAGSILMPPPIWPPGMPPGWPYSPYGRGYDW